jgi:hypothetical protein
LAVGPDAWQTCGGRAPEWTLGGGVIVFGWGEARPKDLGATGPGTCPNCTNQVTFRLYKTTKWFSLFFVPLIPYDTQHLLLCPVCTQGVVLYGGQFERAKGLVQRHEQWRSKAISDDEYAADVAQFWELLQPVEDALAARKSQELTGERPHVQTAAVAAVADLQRTEDMEGAWRPDPSGRHEQRFHDSSGWTAYVFDGGTTSSDAMLRPGQEGWLPDPTLRHDHRYWDGARWTQHVQDQGVPSVDPVAH